MVSNTNRVVSGVAAIALAVTLAGCGGGGGGDGGGGNNQATYTVGGTLTGLGAGLSVTLLNNGGGGLTVTADGAFTFVAGLAGGRTYVVTVGTQPTGQLCAVISGSGTIGSANITNVAVNCVNTHTVGGMVSGLGNGLSVTLLNNGGDPLPVNINGAFTFATAVAEGASYAVTIGTQPTGQVCTVNSGSGTFGTADVSDVDVSCVDAFTVGGTLTGLGTGLSVTLLNNGGDALSVTANGSFEFATALLDAASYNVTVGTQPAGQVCVVSNGSGAIAVADVTNVDVSCAFSNVWVWKDGSNMVAPPGVYGTLGVAAAANAPGGRNWNASWQDPSGNFWIFGGQGYDSTGLGSGLNDLWRYDVSTGNWTWMGGSKLANAIGVYGTQGVSAASNIPGAREYMASWTDAAGDMWLFGGYGFDSTGAVDYLNDLWKYNPGSGQWTWVSGSNTVDSAGVYGTLGVESASNSPGARFGDIWWVDAAGSVWIFGGYGVDSAGILLGYMNDLWRLNPVNGFWTWMGGSSTYGAVGVYGTQGVPAASSVPGARLYTSAWADGSGNFWLFAGAGLDSAGTLDQLNDLWKYDPGTGNWTWMSGSNLTGAIGVYGTQGTPAPGNAPGARGGAMAWADGSGNLWLFGGAGNDSTGATLDELNDLWKYNIASGQWTWVNGSNLVALIGVYGTLNVPSVNTQPGGRDSGTVWVDANGKVWLFGGAGYDSAGNYDMYGMNDIFQYIP